MTDKSAAPSGPMAGIDSAVRNVTGCVTGVLLLGTIFFCLVFATGGMALTGASEPIAKFFGITANTAAGPSTQLFADIYEETRIGLGIPNAPAPDEQNASTSTGSNGTAAQQPTAIPAPNFIKSSQTSEQALLAWRGLDTNGAVLTTGVDLGEVQRLVTAALNDNPKDILALWLQKKLNTCGPLIAKLQEGLTPQNAEEIQSAATNLINSCNPRILAAHAVYRWAALVKIPTGGDIDPNRLSGLDIAILKKVDGPARGLRPNNHIHIVVAEVSGPGWRLAPLDFKITVAQLNQLLGEGSLDANGGGAWWPEMGDVKVPGVFLPANPAEPAVPTDEQLAVPAAVAPPPVSSTPQASAVEGTGGGGESRTYVVRQGEWAMKIVRDYNGSHDPDITLEQLQTANPGVDLVNLQIGQTLNLP